MKTIKYLTCLLILLNSSQSFSQNWFPLEVGNKWQYINIDFGGTFTIPDTTYFNASIYYNEVLSDTSINNSLYYNFSQNPSNWFRFSNAEQKIYYWWQNEDKLIMDFLLPVDSFFISYLPSPANQEVGANVILGDYWLLDTLFTFKGYWWTIAIDGNTGQSIKYVSSYGMVEDSLYYYDNASLSYSITIRKLVQTYISGNNYRGSKAPKIIFNPIYFIQDSSFALNLVVQHSYNIIFPVGSTLNSLNYVDSVYLHGNYSKDDSVIYNPTILAVNSIQTETWEINTILNMDLMREDFAFNYRIEAVDKGMVPHRSFNPVYGYYVAIYDTTSNINLIEENLPSFALSQNYPNPFNPSTTIKYQIPELGFVTLKVYDVLGNEIATFVNEEKQVGTYEVKFNGSEFTSGIYFYELKAGNFVETKKMVLIK